MIRQYILCQQQHCMSLPQPLSQPSKICPHPNKLSKKTVESLVHHNYLPICSVCSKVLNPKNMKISAEKIQVVLCLHCGSLCCDDKCIQKHVTDTHIFWIKLVLKDEPPSLLQSNKIIQQPIKCEIHCKNCGNIDQKLQSTNAIEFSSEQIQNKNKLSRFSQFLHQFIQKSLTEILIQKFNDFIQIGNTTQYDCFGFKNLGNTCFLNTVLQILFYTEPFTDLYLNIEKQLESNTLISRDKQKRRQIEYFYEDKIEKSENENWHVVSDKKSKQSKIKENLQKFVPTGFVKDSKFNNIFIKFFKNINQLKGVSEQKEKLTFEPIQILSGLVQFDAKYQLGQQQDAQQLLILLIDILSQGQLIKILSNNQNKKQRYQKVQTLLGRQKLTPIQQLFGSYLASHIVCLGCGKENWTIDFTYHFPVPLLQHKKQESKQSNIQIGIKNIGYYQELFYPNNNRSKNIQILNPLFQPERLTNRDNYYTCQKCSSLSAIKQFYIIDPPQILIISFKRFQHNKKYKLTKQIPYYQYMAIDKLVLYPKEQQIKALINQKQKQQYLYVYQLYGIIVHKGETISSGHYIAFCKVKSKSSEAWFQFSDHNFRRVTLQEVLKQEAYILFYRSTKGKLNI